MKLKISLLAITALVTISGIQAQTADEIIDKYITAIGGKDVISKVNSIYMESNVQVMGNDVPSKVTILNGKGYKTEMEMNGTTMVYCYNESGGWMINPMMGASDPQPLPEGQVKIGKNQLDIGGILYHYKDKGAKAELLGQEKVGDVNAYKIKITSADSLEMTYYIDPNTYYIIQSDVAGNFNGQDVDIVTTYSDYKATDIGYVMPWSLDTNYGGQFDMPVTITKVEVNKEVDPSIFEMPKQ